MNIPSGVLHLAHGVPNITCEERDEKLDASPVLGRRMEARLTVFVCRGQGGAKLANEVEDEVMKADCIQGAKWILGFPS